MDPHTYSMTPIRQLGSGVAVITLGKPEEKAITLTRDRLNSLKAAIAHVRDIRPPGLIITGPSPDMFSVGADVKVIGSVTDKAEGAKLALEGQSVFNEIAKLPFPTVAAISGPCVGGAYELSLSCRYRICSDNKSTLIGLPETKLGIIPGFGGTQRLPRLVGVQRALDVILTGKTLRASKAAAVGLVSEVVPFVRLESRAESIILNTLPTKERPWSAIEKFLTNTGAGRKLCRNFAIKSVLRETRGFYPAPLSALESIFFGLQNGIDRGLIYEADELGRMIITPESKALVKIFFLTESAKSLGKSAIKALDGVKTAVLGAGTMGAGIAGLIAKNEMRVILKDTDPQALERGVNHIKKMADKLTYLSTTDKKLLIDRVEPTKENTASLGEVGIAIEAIVEKLEIKQEVLSKLAESLPDQALIASNTSSLSITSIAEKIPNPERVIGMHFFNPVEKMPLLEIIRGKKTSNQAVAVTAAFATKLGKYPVVVEDVPGFLVNRILSPYLATATFLLGEGFHAHKIDNAATSFGMPMGPIRLLDEVGLDVAAHVSQILVNAYGDRMKSPPFASKLLSLGRKGKKNSEGFYNYDKNGKAQTFAGLTKALEISKTPPSLVHEDLVDALILSLVNEAIRCLDEGVAGTPGKEAAYQIDLATVMGIGFPPFRGGVLHYAQTLGAKTVVSRLQKLEQKLGERFTPCAGLIKRAETNSDIF